MDIVFETRCTGGKIIVYKDRVSIELKAPLGVVKTDSILINQITGIKTKIITPAILFSKGLGEIIITGSSGQQLKTKITDIKKLRELEKLIYDNKPEVR